MYFEKLARQACAKFIEYNTSMTLLRLQHLMCLLEIDVIIKTGAPLTNSPIVVTKQGIMLKNIDEGYLRDVPDDYGELSPDHIERIEHLWCCYDDPIPQSVLSLKMIHLSCLFTDTKKEYDYIDILRALWFHRRRDRRVSRGVRV